MLITADPEDPKTLRASSQPPGNISSKQLAQKSVSFFQPEQKKAKRGNGDKSKPASVQVKVKSSRAKQLGLKPRTQVSPVMEKCCLAASAKSSYQEAEQDIALMMGLKVGHSTLQRMVLRSEMLEGQNQKPVKALSVDGGSIRLRTEGKGACGWRDYKAVLLALLDLQ